MERSRAQLVEVARAWIGTPYHAQASRYQTGCDCLGLINGVWHDIYGSYPPVLIPAQSGMSLTRKSHLLVKGLEQCLVEKASDEIIPGDVLLFKLRMKDPPLHLGILSAPSRFIHATEKHAVTEVFLHHWWEKRIVTAFSFPGVQ